MKVPLISSSGLLELRNSNVFRRLQRYLRIRYTARTDAARDYPRTECTRTLSVFFIAASMNSKIWWVSVSGCFPLGTSNNTWFSWSSQLNFRYTTPIASQWLGTWRPAQLITWVTLLAITNSKSYKHRHSRIYTLWNKSKSTYLCSKFITNEKAVLDFYRSNHVIWKHHHILLLLHHLLLLLMKHLHLVLLVLLLLLSVATVTTSALTHSIRFWKCNNPKVLFIIKTL